MEVKLCKGLSYRGYGIRATKDKPCVTVSEETGKALIETGHFAAVTAAETAESSEAQGETRKTEDGEEPTPETVDKFTNAQLAAYATVSGISIPKKATRAQIINALSEGLWGGICSTSEESV